MKYTFYDPSTGKIISSAIFGDVETAELNLAGQSYIEGLYYENQYYVVNGQAVAKTANPSTNDVIYYFDYATKTWQPYIDMRVSNTRYQRDQSLAQIDRVNPVWYATLNDPQQQELAQYRQALLDVPQQTGFPESVVWPAKPTWL
jgi:hypothetical protein